MAPRLTMKDGTGIRCCECCARPSLPARTRITRRARWLLKQTLWTPVTTLMDRIGLTLQAVQVLCIDDGADDGAGRVLMLLTGELDRRGRLRLCPVQGLRRPRRLLLAGRRYGEDPREDARRELLEEALLPADADRAPPTDAFEPVARYREGRFGQFDCHVFVVNTRRDAFRLRSETGEGLACWARIDGVAALLPQTPTQAASSRMILAVLARPASPGPAAAGTDRSRPASP
jgi:8-oxo-dGTP pyrophosphatase MutT (NUDIX family)